jgi:hypothetical protein
MQSEASNLLNFRPQLARFAGQSLSQIFDIRVLTPETRFELARDWFDLGICRQIAPYTRRSAHSHALRPKGREATEPPAP